MTRQKDSEKSALDPGALKGVSALTVKVRRLVEGLLGGAHPSVHFGASVEFAEHKKYSPGDDIRRVDWNALARTDRYFVKQQQREVILNALLVLDCSPSMGYRGESARATKLDCAAELLAALAYILVHQGDAAGLLTFSSGVDAYVPPGQRPDQLALLMKRFAAVKPALQGATEYAEAVSKAASLAGKRALVVLATDLWGAKPETEAALTMLAAKGHDISIFHMLDPDELDLPFTRPVRLTGMEGEGIRDVDPSLIREDYRAAAAEFVKRWRRFSTEHGIDFVQATTDRPAASVLLEFAAKRQNARRPR